MCKTAPTTPISSNLFFMNIFILFFGLSFDFMVLEFVQMEWASA